MSQYFKLKKKYITHKSNGHYILEKKEINHIKKYDRASIILIEESYDNNNGRDEPTIILFYETKWNTYTEPGGRIDIKGDNFDQILLETAMREIREETLNTIFIDQKLLENSKYIDFYNQKNKMYNRVFVISIKTNGFKKNIYDDNKDLLSGKDIPSMWKETSNVNRFYISDLLDCIKGQDYNYFDNIPCHDAHNNKTFIYYRTMGIIDMIIKENILKDIISNSRKTKIYGFKVDLEEEKFLQGTMTIKII
ncbi:hypothetical protein Klosneuvirus_1_366 [Klosneuvirus KNV1]|uniref:NUDIX hydrolase n=1 Tax=Klosneuvirus KNV1 TaxID=1977640 RepID=A0A1V0SIG4_9VIRU|nr:hypothetical protein Klosneuvirus_1_366 [Klosneuvirus KNV1]